LNPDESALFVQKAERRVLRSMDETNQGYVMHPSSLCHKGVHTNGEERNRERTKEEEENKQKLTIEN